MSRDAQRAITQCEGPPANSGGYSPHVDAPEHLNLLNFRTT